MASPACFDARPSSAASSLATPERLCVRSETDILAGNWTRESEPAQPSSSGGSAHYSLACEEDESSLELPEAAPQEPVQNTPSQRPVGCAGSSQCSSFLAADTREIIRNELYRQQGLRYVPDGPKARRFASAARPRVVSWLVEVVSALGLSDETLHVAVSLLDRFVAATETLPSENVLQLLALACISVAAKQEEVAQHSSDDWLGLAVDGEGSPLYRRGDLQRMEWLLLENVEWRIRVPNALTFLRHFHHGLAHCPSSRGVVPNDPAGASAFKAIANFLAELSLLYEVFLPYGYSTVATACLVLAEWTASGSAPGAAATHTATPPVNTVVALSALGGIEVASLAPNLAPCVEALHQLYVQTTAGAAGNLPPPVDQLGLLAPVVARYAQALPPPRQ